MARLALVSRNPVMSMALTATEHDLVEVRGFDLEDWIAAQSDADVDALVLDLGSPPTAVRVVGDLRASDRWIPVLLVTTHDHAWSSNELLALPGVEFLSLPLSAEKLQGAVTRVLRLPRTPPPPREHSIPLLDEVAGVPLSPEPELLADSSAVPVEAASEQPSPVKVHSLPAPDDLEQDEQDPLNIASLPEVMPTHAAMAEPEDVAEAKQETDVVLEPPKDDPHDESAVEIPNQKDLFASPAAPKKGQTTKTKEHKPAKPVAPPAQEARPRRRRGKEVAELRLDPRTPIQSQPARHPELAPVPPTAPPATDLESKSPVVQDIVQQMLAEAEGYFTLEEAAQVIVEDAAARASAECAALLVPDGSLWRVAGGVGLRPLEHRLQLTTESWLVANIAGAGKGAIVEGSDVARNNLRGAPLASHTHLLAAPVPQVRAVLLVARERDEPFSEETLTVLATLAEESGPLLDQALKLRSLARGLARHIDPWDAPAS